MLNLDVPYTQISKKKSVFTKLEKAIVAVSAVAAIGLVCAVCMGAFTSGHLGAPVATRSATMMPRLSASTVARSMNRNAMVHAQQTAKIAELKRPSTDGRLGKIAFLAVPVVAWVGFNILGPAQNQLTEMSDKKKAPTKAVRRRGILGGIASAAAGAAALQNADADEIIKALDDMTSE
eukprot:CAMPEP_0167751736 /NCGR_PEP_ID=MMETSP0110_2-20121227/6747_1 /TAXON_ID=629695 /ORGANISM="Gymnochlora sp., Strain CCMP2014" /LENGTH=177 /DNA_ID=CAMNT_0007637271 /DNA_START=67 /DNA_END=600 /DNA_ORIENTATION=-